MSNAKGATLKPHKPHKLGLLYCMSQLGGWVGVRPPPPPGGVGHLSVCGYAKILGGWVPELTPPPPPGWVSKTLEVLFLSNSIAFGKPTSQRIYSKQRTHKIG